MRGKKHSDEVQAQVMAALLAGQGVTEIAKEYKLAKAVVSRWKSNLTGQELEQIGTKKGDKIENLLYEYLTTTLQSLKNQTEIAGEREYITKQPAGEFAILHGVMADKAIRLLEAAERARSGPEVSALPN